MLSNLAPGVNHGASGEAWLRRAQGAASWSLAAEGIHASDLERRTETFPILEEPVC